MKRSYAIGITASILGFLGILLFLYWFLHARFYEYTDDAYVGGNKVIVTPQISGIVTQITADEPDFVQEGRSLVELDPTDSMLMLNAALAELGSSVRYVSQLFQKIPELASLIEKKKAILLQAAQDFEHRKDLIVDSAVSLEDLEHAIAALKSAFADLLLTESQLIAATFEVDNTTIYTHPRVSYAKEKARQAFVHLKRCQLLSPTTGLISQRRVQVGEQVMVGDPLLAVVPLNQMWITANFKEIQLAKVRVGQPAKVRVDLWGNQVTFHGKVIGIGGGTGSVFSVLPPQNATGNWIKIVQRLPVRIALDPEQIKRFPLRLGLSCEVTIDLHDISSQMIPSEKPLTALYETSVISDQLDGADELIDEVIAANISSLFTEDDNDATP